MPRLRIDRATNSTHRQSIATSCMLSSRVCLEVTEATACDEHNSIRQTVESDGSENLCRGGIELSLDAGKPA